MSSGKHKQKIAPHHAELKTWIENTSLQILQSLIFENNKCKGKECKKGRQICAPYELRTWSTTLRAERVKRG